MALRGVYQTGYVTHNIERAIALVGADFGLSQFSHFEVELALQTPGGVKSACLHVGTAWAGAMQVELIQPISGYLDAYLAGLPEDPDDITPRFHHFAVRRESMDLLRRDVANLAMPTVFEAEAAGIASVFVDARARIGHHLEFVCATPEGWAMLGWPKGMT